MAAGAGVNAPAPFGVGLSYTTFTYGDLTVPATAPIGGSLSVSVRVPNSSAGRTSLSVNAVNASTVS